jgi:putative ABC transport system ATP-binding protein
VAILELRGLRKEYRKGDKKVEALRGVELLVDRGEFLSIVGPSGSGKTTLLNIIGCLDTPSSGSVVYNGKELAAMNERELAEYRRQNIAFIFQSYNLIPVLTVQENVELPLVIARRHGKAETAHRAREVIAAVGLDGMAGRLPGELSGGQEQRVAIARALVKDPIVVLADEPTANLDSATAEEIIALMQKMNAERQTTFVFSTHDKRVEHHARRVVVLRDGAVAGDERKQV